MQFNPEHCAKNHFEDHVLRQGNDYDYVWCGLDVDVHTHEDFYEIFILAGDDFYHYHDGVERRISKNTIFFFAPGERHGLFKASPRSVHFSFFAKSSFFERFFAENHLFQDVFKEKNFLSCELTDVEYEYVYKITSLLMQQEHEHQKVSFFLYNVISLLMMYNETGREQGKNDYVEDLVEKINNYTYLTTRIDDIYGQYPVARCTLIKEFKKYTGMTIVQYQKKQKLSYAAQLLMNTDYQISEIANILAFDSFSHFLRIFKEQYGVTPKEYRKNRIHHI